MATPSSKLVNGATARVYLNWRRLRLGLGFQGCASVAFIGRGWGLGVRAKRGAAARAAGSDSSLSPARSGEGDEPDGRGPLGGHREGGEAKRAGAETGPRRLRWAGGGDKWARARFWAAEKEKEKGEGRKESWAGLG